ncbi:MAG: putative integral rane acyltransferase [Acidimicrobiales bacterium]|nr:putative integral rane acyltransferase [Acidimicrobiales bacterium]
MSTGDAVVEPRKGAWFPCFDGLRAIAAVTVVFHHAGFATGASFRSGGSYLARMDSGVTVFFLISGFLLYRPFVAAHLDEREPMPARRFYRRRLLRIFPAYWVALTGVVLFFGVSLPAFTDAWVHYGLFQIYDIHRYFNAISQSWTLATELSFYLVVPGFAWLVRHLAGDRDRRGRVRVELVVLAVVFAASLGVRSLLFPVSPDSSSWHVLLRYWLPANMDLFAVGMAMAVGSVALAGRDRAADGPFTRAFPYVSWGLGLVAFWVVANHAGLPLGLKDASPAGEWAKHLLYLAYALGLVAPAVFGPQDKSLVRRLLRFSPLAGLGVISYGIYLWHQAWIHQVSLWGHHELFRTPYWQVTLPALALTVVTATASYWLVEKPLLRLKDRPGRAAAAPAPEAVVATAPAP